MDAAAYAQLTQAIEAFKAPVEVLLVGHGVSLAQVMRRGKSFSNTRIVHPFTPNVNVLYVFDEYTFCI